MPTTFVLVRHAEGYHNVDGYIRGENAYKDPIHIDAELTKVGIQQAKDNHMGNEKFDAIYSSPMKRCRQTLLYMYPQAEHLPVILDDRLIEHPQGIYMCNMRSEKSNIVKSVPQIWSTDKVFNRNPHILNTSVDENNLISFTKYIKTTHPNQKVLIITHGKWIDNWLLKYKYVTRYINNCEIIRETI